MMIDKKMLCAATPDEEKLAGLIESDVLHALVLGQPTSVFLYNSLFTAAQLYQVRHGVMKYHVLSPDGMEDMLLGLKSVCGSIEVLKMSDMCSILTCFLGCRFVVLMADDVELLSLARYFCLPVVRVKKGRKSPLLCNGVLEIGDTAAMLAGTFFVIKTGKYEEQLLNNKRN